MPSTLERSPPRAQRTYQETLEHAEQEYGDGERAHRTAFAVLKRAFEKVGSRWLPKRRRGRGETSGGVDAFGNSRKELIQRARKLGIRGRSRMNKGQLAKAIARKQ